jgi:hypothetical protein
MFTTLGADVRTRTSGGFKGFGWVMGMAVPMSAGLGMCDLNSSLRMLALLEWAPN